MDNETLTSELKGHRTLATVVFTDCVGFSARMSVDEEHTLDLIRRDLKLMKHICLTFEGRVLKSTGDGLLMCFSSAVKAVECAIAIQTEISTASAQRPTRNSLVHRIGIHLADMYITPTDVMGNGVNIAARLQTEADPGGICISQTVYDVAKHGLQLVTRYLGPRELKNIREVVPAYKVLLNSGDKVDSNPYSEIANRFEQNQNLSRIKKLIFYTCKNYWENDSATLNNLELEALVQEFLELAQTFEQLKDKLETVVKTLSKKIEYTLIANDILRGVASFYALDNPSNPALLIGTESSTHIIKRDHLAQNNDQQALYQLIGRALDQDLDILRIKKLLFYICRRQWEGEPKRLESVPTADLLQELYHQASAAEQLTRLVNRFVQTLNKRAEYALVAQTLIGHLVLLYPDLDLSVEPTQLPTQALSEHAPNPLYPAIAARLEQDPHATRIKKLMVYVGRSQWLSNAEQLSAISMGHLIEEIHQRAATFPQLQSQFGSAIETLSKPSEYAAFATLITAALKTLYPETIPPTVVAPETISPKADSESALPTTKPDQPCAEITPSAEKSTSKQAASTLSVLKQTAPSEINLFDIRLGILKYTNPLRAKILLFSALYSDFTFSYQDWLSLKQHELTNLLQEILKTCITYTDLELKLYGAANRLQNPEEHVQAADTVIKCLREFYIHGSPLLHFANSSEPTQISLDDFEAATLGFGKTGNTENDHTTQLAPAIFAVDSSAESSQPSVAKTSSYEENTCLLPAMETGSNLGSNSKNRDALGTRSRTSAGIE
jgi:adenylate cyclase